MLKNENSITKNQKIKIPLIERIIVCGIQKKQLNEIKPSIISNEESLIEYLSNLNLEILEEYTSSMIFISGRYQIKTLFKFIIL